MLLFAAAVALAACGDDDGGTRDSGPTPPPGDAGDDGGPPPRDMGTPPLDMGTPPRDMGTPPRDGGGPATNVPGRHDLELDSEGETRHAIVYVPESAAGDVAAPVVVMVHGTSQDGEHFYTESRWIAEADANGIIVVYPDALTYCFHQDENGDGDFEDPGERKITSKWSSGFFDDPTHPLCTAAEIAALGPAMRALVDHPLRDDIAFFDALLDRLESDFVVDARRIYATGFSNGGQMASRLGLEMSTRFAAVASHAGFLDVEARAADRPIAFALSVGSVDDRFVTAPITIPLDETVLAVPYFQRLVADYRTVTQLGEAYTHETVMMGMRTVSRFSWTTSPMGADNRIELAIIEGVPHVYPEIEPQLWMFFSRYSLP